MLLAGRSLARRLATSTASATGPVATFGQAGSTACQSLRAAAAAKALSTSARPPTEGTNTPVWPPPRSQLARMYEDEEDDFNSNDPERRAAAALRRQREREAAQGDDYLDDHHYVPGGGAGNASLSPHHEGYEEEVEVARRQQRRDLLTRRASSNLPQDLKAAQEHPSSNNNDDDQDNGTGAGAVGGGSAGGSGSSDPASGGNGGSGPGWSWAQPVGDRQARGPGGRRLAAAVAIPVKPRTLLAAEEVVAALEGLGGQDMQVVDVRGKGNLDAEAMVFASGRSGAHLRRMADTLVLALKQRGISEREAPGVTGAEGYDCDDWMIVDGGNLIVHLMEPRQRKALALEEHWGQADFEGITLPPTRSDAAWASAHDQALEANPPDDDYDPLRDDHAARERAFRRLVHGKAGGRVRVRGGRVGRK